MTMDEQKRRELDEQEAEGLRRLKANPDDQGAKDTLKQIMMQREADEIPPEAGPPIWAKRRGEGES